MKKFGLTSMKTNSGLHISLAGEIDEDAIIPTIDFKDAKQIAINWKNVTLINSCGVREWIKWLSNIPENISITYTDCPKIIVDQINLVNGFLRTKSTVSSFYVPYFCEKCKIQTLIHAFSGKEFNGSEVKLPDVKCSQCNGETEIDVVEAKYFKFLGR